RTPAGAADRQGRTRWLHPGADGPALDARARQAADGPGQGQEAARQARRHQAARLGTREKSRDARPRLRELGRAVVVLASYGADLGSTVTGSPTCMPSCMAAR